MGKAITSGIVCSLIVNKAQEVENLCKFPSGFRCPGFRSKVYLERCVSVPVTRIAASLVRNSWGSI